MTRRNQELWLGYSITLAGLLAWTLSIIVVASCTAALVPSGKPSCPNRTLWSDSAQRCIAREGR